MHILLSRSVSSIVLIIFLCPILAWSIGNEPTLPLPDPNRATFRPHGMDFWRNELPHYFSEGLPFDFVLSGGIHATGPTCTSMPFTTIAHTTSGNRVRASKDNSGLAQAINYQAVGCNCANPGSATAWVIASATSADVLGNFIRSPLSNYFVNCIDGPQPTLPSDSAWLMRTALIDGAITAVTDLRKTDLFASFPPGPPGPSSPYLVNTPCNGIANDTTAIQAAMTAAQSTTTVVELPTGTCLHTGLLYAGSPGIALHLRGQTLPGIGFTGTVLKYIGASGGTGLEFRGANNSIIENINFHGNSLAKYNIWLTPGATSAFNTITNVVGVCAAGTDSANIRVGDDTSAQVSETAVHHAVLYGNCNAVLGSTWYGLVMGQYNTKDLTIDQNSVSLGHRYGFIHGSSNGGPTGNGSGYFNIDGVFFGLQTVADIVQNGGTLSLSHWNAELTTGKLLIGGGAEINNSVTMQDGQWTGVAGSDDIVVDFQGQLVMQNTTLWNVRECNPGPCNHPPKVIVRGTSAGTSPFTVLSQNVTYYNVKDVAPFYATSILHILNVAGQPPYLVTSLHDWGLDPFVGTTPLRELHGTVPTNLSLSLPEDTSPPPGITILHNGETRYATKIIDVDKAFFTSAALVQGYTFTLPAHVIIRDVLTDTTQAFTGTGLTGNLLLAVGDDSDASAYVYGHDVKTAPVFCCVTDLERGNKLRSGPQVGQTVTISRTDISAAFADSSFNTVSGNFVTSGVVPSMLLQVSGFATAANNRLWKVFTVSPTKIQVAGTVTDEAAGNSILMFDIYNRSRTGGRVVAWTAGSPVNIYLISSVGNLGNGAVTNLSTGHTIVYIIYEKLPQ